MTLRRNFLKTTAGALVMAPALLSQNSKVRMGVIGCGWYGLVDMNAAFEAGGVECVAVCDVDSEHLTTAANDIEKRQGTRPKTFSDYREMYEMPNLDAVIIATPPQWHALPFIDACKKGLAIYAEKPLGYDIREGRAMVDAWKQAGNIVKFGFQRRTGANFNAARDYIRAGNAGRIVQVDVNIHYTAEVRDTTPQDPPASLDWEHWCGPAPKLPYCPNIGHMTWRLEEKYGNGHLVDWGIHLIDMTRYILDLGVPKSVTSVGGIYEYVGKITTPDTLTTHFEYEQCPVVWRHRCWGAAEYDPTLLRGIFFFGEKETVYANDDRWAIVPRGKEPKKLLVEEGPEVRVLSVDSFLKAVRAGKPADCPPDDAYKATVAVQLGMIAYKTGARVDWDPETESIPNNPAGQALLKREYRAPYVHPYKG